MPPALLPLVMGSKYVKPEQLMHILMLEVPLPPPPPPLKFISFHIPILNVKYLYVAFNENDILTKISP
jgi:hypothetical protein